MEEALLTIDLKLILPLVIISGILLVVAIFDWAKQGENTRGNRWIWFVLIVFVHTVGPILYFIFGRRR